MKIRAILIAFICLFLGSCNITRPHNMDNAGKIIFTIKEVHFSSDDQEPELYLFLQTENDYSCCNFRINTDFLVQGNDIVIDILGVELPGDVCLTAIGPARANIPLYLSNDTYSLKITYQGIRDKYTIINTDSSIICNGASTIRTEPDIRLFWKYPEKSFALFYGSSLQDSAISEVFIDTLNQVLTLREFTFPDSGTWPYPSSSSGHAWDMPAKYYFYENENDYGRIEGIIRSFKQSHEPGSISTFNWRNIWHRSWIIN